MRENPIMATKHTPATVLDPLARTSSQAYMAWYWARRTLVYVVWSAVKDHVPADDVVQTVTDLVNHANWTVCGLARLTLRDVKNVLRNDVNAPWVGKETHRRTISRLRRALGYAQQPPKMVLRTAGNSTAREKVAANKRPATLRLFA